MIQKRYNTAYHSKQRLFAYRPQSKRAGGGVETPSWRDFFKVHPAAEVFPLLSPDELRKLAADIDQNGLSVPIVTCHVAGKDGGHTYLLDGRNRLDAMELLGRQIVNDKGNWIGTLAPVGKNYVEHLVGYTEKEAVAIILGLNIRRRHLTKQQQVELIDKMLRASRQHGKVFNETPYEATDSANMARSVKRNAAGRLQGSTKDEHKAAVITQAARVGISKRTVERHFTKAKPRKPKPPPNRLAPDYIHKRFGKFLMHWPHEQQRKVREWLFDYLSPK